MTLFDEVRLRFLGKKKKKREEFSIMSGAVLVAVAAAIGNLLQGWDNATIAGDLILMFFEIHNF